MPEPIASRTEGRPPWSRPAPVALAIALAWAIPVAADDPPEPTWTAEQRQHWSFVPPARPELPELKRADWARNPIDRFIGAQAEAAGVAPSAEADRATLIRRLRFDLTGLPPSPEEVDFFRADPAPDAYERLVERLLGSPQYGERWARHWLDLARFAESDGFKNDKTRPNAWRYRDWVVRAFNDDMPYDRFVRLQLAGDEVEPGDSDAFVATGFNRSYPFEDNNMVPGLNDHLILDDMTDTTCSVVLALTVACARCHDHKYDPISHRDYYKIRALFAATRATDDRVVAPPEDQAAYTSIRAEHDARVDFVRRQVELIEQPYAAELLKDALAKLPVDVRAAFEASPTLRTEEQDRLVRKHAKAMTAEPGKMKAAMPEPVRAAWQGRRQEMDALAAQAPTPLPTASGMTDAGPDAPPMRLLRKGNPANPGDVIEPGFLSVLPSGALPAPDPSASTTGRRKALADWAASPSNPLTARVIVNRLWQGHFGRGIVATASDFGTQGSTPTHPELLDWLATELVDRGWSLKAIHRLMVTSATYRQSSLADPRTIEADPDNLLFSRMTRKRLEGEAVRDAMLASSGEINLAVGGPSVFPDLPAGVEAKNGGWPRSKAASERNRRSLYVFARRNLKYPLFDAFDVPDTNLTCPERNVSVNAPQALMLLNSPMVLDHARALAGRVYAGLDNPADPATLVDRAFRLALVRAPGEAERRRALGFLETQAGHASGPEGGSHLPIPMPEGPTPASASAVVDLCHALLNLNEFVYVD